MKVSGALLCVGLTTVDVVAVPVCTEDFEGVRLIDAISVSPAGTAAGAALVAATLGVQTQLAGAVGDDALGRFARAELAYAGVDVSLLEVLSGRTTSATLIPVDNPLRRRMFHAPGASPYMQAGAELTRAATNARAVHYAGVGAPNLDRLAPALLLAARNAGALVTCDLISPGPHAVEQVRAVLPHVDVFMPSAVEARFLTGERDLVAAARSLQAWGAGSVIIKNGAEGALALGADHRVDTLPALPIAKLVDTTSCGDSFCAGFLAATLSGRPWRAAVRFAAATAALVAQGPATLGLLRSAAQVNALLAQEGMA